MRRLLAAVMVATTLLAMSPGRAGAAPPADPPLVGPGERLVLSMTKTQDVTPPGNAARQAAEEDDSNLTLRRLFYKEQDVDFGEPAGASSAVAAAPISVVDCAADPYADTTGGFVIDHYNWCYTVGYSVELQVCQINILGLCLKDREIGTASWRMSVKGDGWDADMPEARPGMSQIGFIAMIHDIEVSNPLLEAMALQLDLTCDPEGTALCQALPGETQTNRTVAEWRGDSGTYFRYLVDPDFGAVGRDKLSWFDFDIKTTTSYPSANSLNDTVRGNSFRCDSAVYLKGERGCVFDNVVEILTYSMDSRTKYRKAALHMWEAYNQPAKTKPDLPGKNVPGNALAPQRRALTRLFEPYDSAIARDNNAEAVRTCKQWWGDDYSQGGQFECDEFPFKTTYQGASLANGHYSARVIDATDNGSSGGVWSNWSWKQRVLHEDSFYINLKLDDGGAGGGTPLPDGGPAVSAGPDVTGYEGSPIALRGAVHDREAAASAHWSYRIVSGSPGMSCQFRDADAVVTRIVCSNEGVVEVTLTADDGVNASASDSATVTVINAPPKIEITSPDPWQVFKAGTSVPLRAPFTDPGSQDTHSCTVTWDDGNPADSYPATSHTCDRDHTFPHAGMYTLTVKVTDDAGASDEATTMVVVYDPNAGFDNADGSFASPQGAWRAQPATTGVMNFHLTARYYGPDKPTGTARAYLANTTLRLDAVENGLEWLVVTPDGKVAAKGIGTINGQSGYGFVYYGYDGCSTGPVVACQPGPDKFRMVLWPLSSGPVPGNETLYDNRAGAGYDVDVTNPQQLGTGAVTIHPPTID
ncbi:PKD domain-containing protein [Actinomycetes bacterium KLBMP 9797]